MGLFYNAPEPTRGLSLANNVENIDRGEVCACTSMTPKSTRPFLRGGDPRAPLSSHGSLGPIEVLIRNGTWTVQSAGLGADSREKQTHTHRQATLHA